MDEFPWPKENRRKSDEWFRLLVETMNEGLGVLDENGLIIYVNTRLCEITGYSKDELVGHPWGSFIEEAHRAIVKEQMARRRSGESTPYEIAWTAKDGRKVFTSISPRSIFDQEGNFKGSFAVITDITGRKQAEEQLLKLSSALEQSPASVFITDTAGNIEYVNPRFTQLTGYTAEEVIGKNPRILQSEETPPEVYKRLWETITAHREWRGEIQDRKKSGELYWALESISPIRDARGAVTHFLALQEDITARKQAEAALIESERKYSTLVESSMTGIYILQDGKIAYANTKLAQIFGHSRDELGGMEFWKLLHEEYRSLLNEIHTKRLRGEEAPSDYKVQAIKKEGEIIWIKGCENLIEYQDRPAILGNIADVTAEKRMEEILWKSERELRILSTQLLTAQEYERKRIASELHDGIGQYLSAIKFSLEGFNALLGKDAMESSAKALENIARMLEKALDEMRRISMDLRPSILDDLGVLATINWFCREFQSVYSGIHIEKDIRIQENEVPASLKIVIFRILQEALNNIAKHAHADRVKLQLHRTDTMIEMLIEDNGVGFELGEVLSRERTRRGVGILSMRERTELAGGTFSIKSTLGAGTAVRATWPG